MTPTKGGPTVRGTWRNHVWPAEILFPWETFNLQLSLLPLKIKWGQDHFLSFKIKHTYIFHVIFPLHASPKLQVRTLRSKENERLTNPGGPLGLREIQQAQKCNTQPLRPGQAGQEKEDANSIEK